MAIPHTRPGRRRHPLTLLLAMLAAMALLVAACGDDGGGDGGGGDAGGDGDGTPTQDDDPSEADPDGVVQHGTDLVGTAAGIFTLDPAEVTTSITNSSLFRHIYGSFMRPTIDGEMVPDLAESTEVVDENTVVINLRDGVTFSDGSPFDAEAVKTGLERTLAEGDEAGVAEAFRAVDSVEATDPLTVTVNFTDGSAAGWHEAYITSWETTIVKPDDDFEMPIGAGPFEVTEYTPEQSMTLTKRDDYWDAESILIAGVEVTHVADSQAAVSALSADQLDIANMDPGQTDALSGGDDFLFVADSSALANFQICKSEAPLDDPDVRRALGTSIDRDAIVEALFGGSYEPAVGLWPADHPFHDPANEAAVAYDPEGAAQLLEDAGFADGLEIDMYVIQSGGMPEVAEVMQAQWGEIGVTANLIPADNYVDDFLTSNSAGLGLIPVMGVPKTLQWTTDTIGNACGYSDPDLNDLAAELDAVDPTSDEAVDLWHQFEAAVVEDALSGLLFFGGTTVGYSSDTLGNAAVEPGTIPFVDPRTTFVKAG